VNLPPQALPSSPRRLLIAHRGACLHAPENSLAAFDLALAQGCHGFEFDVRLTSDSVPVVFHDETLAGAAIAAISFGELQELAKLAGKGPLATLGEVLQRYAGTAILDIELKVAGMETLVLSALRKNPPQCTFWVSSFLPEVLTRMHELDAGIALGLICRNRDQMRGWRELPLAAMILNRSLISAELVREVQAAGRRVFVWTVNDPHEMRQLQALGVDGIISDETVRMTAALKATE
jgi:glycerophosphoryl diester phosphodiesterase